MYESEDSFIGIDFLNMFVVRILSRNISGTYGRDHEKVVIILMENNFCGTN